MAFTHVFADSASVYAITADGSLLWYRDELKDGTNGPNAQRGWAPFSGSQVGFGWTGFKAVFAGDDGVVYAVRKTGELLWYRDLLRNGTNGARAQQGWAADSGRQIGGGWAGFQRVFSGGAGIIYAIRETGELLFYRDSLRDGSNGPNGDRGWASNSGKQIGVGWADFSHVFHGGNGVIYAIKQTGELLWYRDERRDGTNNSDGSSGWAVNSGAQIGFGWHFTEVFSPGAGDGVIYSITETSDLLFYRDDLRDGTNGPEARRGWTANSGAQIGLGWDLQPERRVEGYAVPLSVRAGESVALKVSASSACTAEMQLVRLLEQQDGSVGLPVTDPVDIQLQRQPVPGEAWQNGCDWAVTATLDIAADLPSGLYSARITVDADTVTDIVFVVRPATAATKAPILSLANTDCWNAYNAWGGRSNYSVPNSGVTLSFERPNPETVPDVRTADGHASNHLVAGEVWLLSWLAMQGFDCDLCSDADLHADTVGLGGYKALVLSTHPEYWSQQMAANVQGYLDGGGCLLYLGGNGAFRTVEFSADGTAMTTGADEGHWCANAWQPEGPMPRALLGVAYDVGKDANYPQRVLALIVDDASHRFFSGTGLANGEVFGITGRNGGGACGWEVDCASGDFVGGPQAAGLQILAHGQLVTGAGYRGDIAYYDVAAGGFVLAIGSITVTGALNSDAPLSRFVKNAVSEAISR